MTLPLRIKEVWKLDYPLALKQLSGEVNDNYLCTNNRVVIKCYNKRFSEANIKNSLIAQEAFYKEGLSAEVLRTQNGTLYFFDSEEKRFYSISRYLCGTTISREEIGVEEITELGLSLGKWHRILESISVSLTKENNLISVIRVEDAKKKFEQLIGKKKRCASN